MAATVEIAGEGHIVGAVHRATDGLSIGPQLNALLHPEVHCGILVSLCDALGDVLQMLVYLDPVRIFRGASALHGDVLGHGHGDQRRLRVDGLGCTGDLPGRAGFVIPFVGVVLPRDRAAVVGLPLLRDGRLVGGAGSPFDRRRIPDDVRARLSFDRLGRPSSGFAPRGGRLALMPLVAVAVYGVARDELEERAVVVAPLVARRFELELDLGGGDQLIRGIYPNAILNIFGGYAAGIA